ncbi:MAG: hypothetical protein HY810_10760, partial [Candidatus Omnitrophica bacterium]|nr:hypothetical protein [Candidatus Omnitrophota bacterium]
MKNHKLLKITGLALIHFQFIFSIAAACPVFNYKSISQADTPVLSPKLNITIGLFQKAYLDIIKKDTSVKVSQINYAKVSTQNKKPQKLFSSEQLFRFIFHATIPILFALLTTTLWFYSAAIISFILFCAYSHIPYLELQATETFQHQYANKKLISLLDNDTSIKKRIQSLKDADVISIIKQHLPSTGEPHEILSVYVNGSFLDFKFMDIGLSGVNDIDFTIVATGDIFNVIYTKIPEGIWIADEIGGMRIKKISFFIIGEEILKGKIPKNLLASPKTFFFWLLRFDIKHILSGKHLWGKYHNASLSTIHFSIASHALNFPISVDVFNR